MSSNAHDLLQRFREGERSAFEEIVGRLKSDLGRDYGFLLVDADIERCREAYRTAWETWRSFENRRTNQLAKTVAAYTELGEGVTPNSQEEFS